MKRLNSIERFSVKCFEFFFFQQGKRFFKLININHEYSVLMALKHKTVGILHIDAIAA